MKLFSADRILEFFKKKEKPPKPPIPFINAYDIESLESRKLSAKIQRRIPDPNPEVLQRMPTLLPNLYKRSKYAKNWDGYDWARKLSVVNVLCRFSFQRPDLTEIKEKLLDLLKTKQDQYDYIRNTIWRWSNDPETEMMKYKVGYGQEFQSNKFGRTKEAFPNSTAEAVICAIDNDGDNRKHNRVGLTATHFRNLGIDRQYWGDGREYDSIIITNLRNNKTIQVNPYNACGERGIFGPGVRISQPLAEKLELSLGDKVVIKKGKLNLEFSLEEKK